MSLIPFFTTWLLGWIAYRLIYRADSSLNPITLGLTWLLGAGVVYAVYYSSILLLQVVPHPLALIMPAMLGTIDFIRFSRKYSLEGWQAFYDEPRWTLLLFIIIVIMIGLTGVMGYASDTTSFWQGRAFALAQRPDYGYLLRTFPVHPDYPVLFTHQYQWQFTFSDSVLGTKLPTIGFFIATLCAVFSLLKDTQHPIRWVCLTAGLPLNFFLVPIGLADMPLGAYAIMGVCLINLILFNDGDQKQKTRHGIIAGIMFGLMMVVKIEGLLLFVCICASIVYQLWKGTERRMTLRLLAMLILLSGGFFLSWRLVVWSVPPIYSDFALSAFNINRIEIILQTVMPILLYPMTFAGLWIIFVVLLVSGFRKYVLIWLPAALYMMGMMFAYLFSNYGSVEVHIIDSFERLIYQVMPLGMVYLGQVFQSDRSI